MSNYGIGPLIDESQPVRIPDRADDDVRAAVAAVGAKENRERIASDVGLAGVRAVRQWDDLADKVGPQQAAQTAAQLYRQQPKGAKPAEPEHDDPTDHHAAARKAFRQVAERERVTSELPQTLEHLDAIERRHGNLDVIETRKRWHNQLAANPVDAAPRVAAELAGEMNHRATFPHYEQLAGDFIARHKVTEDELQYMMRAVTELQSSGNKADDLRAAYAYAQHCTAADIEDSHERDVIAAVRAQDGPARYLALLQVADFERSHPGIKRDGPTWRRMKQLLEEGRAQDLDDAYAQARR